MGHPSKKCFSSSTTSPKQTLHTLSSSLSPTHLPLSILRLLVPPLIIVNCLRSLYRILLNNLLELIWFLSFYIILVCFSPSFCLSNLPLLFSLGSSLSGYPNFYLQQILGFPKHVLNSNLSGISRSSSTNFAYLSSLL